MNAPRCTELDYIQFLVASPADLSAVRRPPACNPTRPVAPAHDSFTRLLHRLEPDPETLWDEAEPLVEKAKGVLVIDDSHPRQALRQAHRPGHPPLVGQAPRGRPRDQPDHPAVDRRRPQDPGRLPPLQQGRRQDQERPLLGDAPDGQGPRLLPEVRAVRRLVRQPGEPQAGPRPRLALADPAEGQPPGHARGPGRAAAGRGGGLGAPGTVRPPAGLRAGPGVPDRRPRRRHGVLGDQRPGDGRRGCGGSTPRWASRSRTTTGS